MAKRFLCGIIVMLLISLSFWSAAETVIYLHDASTGVTEEIRLSMEEGFPEGSMALYLQGLQIVSQRDTRFADAAYRYIRKEPFSRSGCGPASLHNAIAALFGLDEADTSAALLLEIMNLLANSNDPVNNPINYQRVVNKLVAPDPERYPVMSGLWSRCGLVSGVGNATSKKILAEVGKSDGSALIIGRFSLNTSMSDLVSLADALCRGGHGNAIIAFGNVSTGDADSKAPFCMGDNGHYISFVIQAQDFRDTGNVYILDSFPRAIRGENVNDLYTTRYYFAANNILTPFRVNYDVTRISPTAIMCSLREEPAAELARLRETAESGRSRDLNAYLRAQSRLSSFLKTFGTGTIFVRIMDDIP